MSFYPTKRSSLGHLQLELLTALWNKEMYGLEIKHYLKTRGRSVSSSQLYPALNKLNDLGFVDATEHVQVGANKIYYKSTKKGREEVITYLNYIFMLIADVAVEGFHDYLKPIFEMTTINPGLIIADFSSRIFEYFVRDVSQQIKPTWRYFITAREEDQIEYLEERIDFYKMTKSTSILTVVNDRTELYDNSVDLIFVYYTMNEIASDWIIPEAYRVLKTGGKAIFVESKEPETHIGIMTFLQFVPVATHFGILSDEFEQKLLDTGFEIVSKNEEQGILYYNTIKNN